MAAVEIGRALTFIAHTINGLSETVEDTRIDYAIKKVADAFAPKAKVKPTPKKKRKR
jgi:hypothetical protein